MQITIFQRFLFHLWFFYFSLWELSESLNIFLIKGFVEFFLISLKLLYGLNVVLALILER